MNIKAVIPSLNPIINTISIEKNRKNDFIYQSLIIYNDIITIRDKSKLTKNNI